jgi:hypothetical protein
MTPERHDQSTATPLDRWARQQGRHDTEPKDDEHDE